MLSGGLLGGALLLSSLQSMLCKKAGKKANQFSSQPDSEEYSSPRVDLAENKAKMCSFNVHIHSMLNWIKLQYSAPAVLEGHSSARSNLA